MNPEERKAKQREYHRKWAAANPEKVREYRRRFELKHPGQIAEWKRAWQAANPGKRAESNRRYQSNLRRLAALGRQAEATGMKPKPQEPRG